jgi:hypothetical protein
MLSQRRKLTTKQHVHECILDVQHRCATAARTQVVCSGAVVSAHIGSIFAELGLHTELHILHITVMTGDTPALEESLQRLIHIRRNTLDEIYVRTSSPLQLIDIAYLVRTCAHLRSISILDHHANILDTLHECDALKLRQLMCLFISPATPTSDEDYCKLHNALPQFMPMAESVIGIAVHKHACVQICIQHRQSALPSDTIVAIVDGWLTRSLTQRLVLSLSVDRVDSAVCDLRLKSLPTVRHVIHKRIAGDTQRYILITETGRYFEIELW